MRELAEQRRVVRPVYDATSRSRVGSPTILLIQLINDTRYDRHFNCLSIMSFRPFKAQRYSIIYASYSSFQLHLRSPLIRPMLVTPLHFRYSSASIVLLPGLVRI